MTYDRNRILQEKYFEVIERVLVQVPEYKEKTDKVIEHLKTKNKVLFLTTSNRWEGDKEIPKSTLLAQYIQSKVGDSVELIDVSKLTIHCCEGNVSRKDGNNCGVKEAVLKDKEKNPTGDHRCWASINNKDDELWKISKPLFESDVILFFVSIRWGQTNSIYQKLIERLDWLENRHTTLKESNIIEDKEVGIIAIGQNWNGANVVEVQKKVLDFYGFKVIEDMCFNWQFTKNAEDESEKSYKEAPKAFAQAFDIKLTK
jgi:multimeric flavodoxin WrbA